MLYGCILSPNDDRDYVAADHICMGVRPAQYFPEKTAPVLNQGSVNSCVGHAIATVKWYHEYRERKSEYEHSTDFQYHCRKPTDHHGQGMIMREAALNLVNVGSVLKDKLPTNTEYPNEAVKVIVDALKPLAGEYKAGSVVREYTIDEICEAIYQHGACLIAVPVYASFNTFVLRKANNMTVPMPGKNERVLGYHAVCAMAYDENGIIIQNSWGSWWGHEGFAKLPYNYTIEESWAIVDEKKNWDILELKVGEVDYTINSEHRKLDAPPIIVNNRTMVPLRLISEALGADVEWIESERKVVVRKKR